MAHGGPDIAREERGRRASRKWHGVVVHSISDVTMVMGKQARVGQPQLEGSTLKAQGQ